MIKFKTRKLNKLIFTAVCAVTLLLLLLLTDPNQVALPILITPFLLIGFIIYGLVQFFLGHRPSSSSYKSRLFPLSLSFLGVALLLLRSLHQLTLKDGLLVCAFTGAFWLYVWRADFLSK